MHCHCACCTRQQPAYTLSKTVKLLYGESLHKAVANKLISERTLESVLCLCKLGCLRFNYVIKALAFLKSSENGVQLTEVIEELMYLDVLLRLFRNRTTAEYTVHNTTTFW